MKNNVERGGNAKVREVIHIFHTNDLHSQFRYWLRMQQFIQTERKKLEEQGDTTLLIDIGDHIDRSDTYTDATLGKGVVSVLNDAHYNFVTMGNNEGITLSHEELYRMKDPEWRLTQVVDPQQHDDATRLFLALYAIRTRKVFSRPQRDHMGLYAVKNTLEHIFPNLSDNTLALQLVCASNPALGSLWVHQKEHQGKAVDMMALELLAYQDRYTLTRKHYARMSDDEFIMWVNPKIQQELAFSSMRDNNKRNSYPKEKIPLLYEHNPW